MNRWILLLVLLLLAACGSQETQVVTVVVTATEDTVPPETFAPTMPTMAPPPTATPTMPMPTQTSTAMPTATPTIESGLECQSGTLYPLMEDIPGDGVEPVLLIPSEDGMGIRDEGVSLNESYGFCAWTWRESQGVTYLGGVAVTEEEEAQQGWIAQTLIVGGGSLTESFLTQRFGPEASNWALD